jgi:transcriptional regulator with XRE-family HTH domain
MEFHERLRAMRDKIGLKQNEAAQKIGVKNNTLSSYESGDRQPDYNTLIKLADLYEISVEYLLRGTESVKKGNKNLFFFDTEGLNDEEIEDIQRHINYVKWKSEQERKNDEKGEK